MKNKKQALHKKLEKSLKNDENWKYFKKVESHRSYLLAMSMYKYKKYGENNLHLETKNDKSEI